MTFSVIDIETTGGSPKSSKITEIAIITVRDGEIVDQYSTLVDPERPIPPFVAKLTGISNKMVSKAPKFFEVAKEVVKRTEGTVFVAHNAAFDYGILREEFKSLGYDYRRATLCTVKSAKSIMPGLQSYSLDRVIDHLELVCEDRHRAKDDALATAELLKHLNQLNTKALERMIIAEIDPKNLHPDLDLNTIDDLPARAGVYYLKDDKGDVIYVGKSKSIRSRVKAHLRGKGSLKAEKMQPMIASVEYELTGSELIALLLEQFEIKTRKPHFNRAGRRPATGHGLYSYTDQAGYTRFHIQKVGTTEEAHIEFSTRIEAKNFLENAVERYGLCAVKANLEKASKACFQHQVGNCKGACVELESHEEYNSRVSEFMNDIQLDKKDFLIVTRGREKNERGVVYVSRGRYMGYGFIPSLALKRNPKQVRKWIVSHPHNKDAQTIIRSFLNSSGPKLPKVIWLQ